MRFLITFLRTQIRIALTMTVYLFGDDLITLYVDGLRMLNSNYPNVASTNISTASSLLAISVFNYISYTGALLSFTYGGCITDNVTWRCTDTYYPNWNKIDYDDISWPLASSQYKNKDLVIDWELGFSQFSDTCFVISYPFNYFLIDYTYYCRHWLN